MGNSERMSGESSHLQSMLQNAVQSVQWTYSLFWQICPQQGILVWSDGYYNGPIKTRKTVQPMEVSAEEASLQRSQQLRELYESLSAGETARPSAALSPEDLTETEWFFLMCVSFSFPPGTGLPGKAYTKAHHVWLTGSNEVDSKVFSRAILAKSAHIQTVVCIPMLDGVVEFGTTDKVKENTGFIQQVKSFFVGSVSVNGSLTPKPALSEHSTSNPPPSSSTRFSSPPLQAIFAIAAEQHQTQHQPNTLNENPEDNSETGDQIHEGLAEPSELMQVDLSEDIRIGSPDDGSNHLDSDYNLLGRQKLRCGDSFNKSGTEIFHADRLEEFTQEDAHYSQTVSTVLHQPQRWPAPFSSSPHSNSSFFKWTPRSDHLLPLPLDETSQWLLKYILFSVPFLHSKSHNPTSPKSRDNSLPTTGTQQQDELSANHVLAERRRREKLNERFIILRSLVPFVTKMDKASILGDTIEYVKQLRHKIQDLETSTVRSSDPDTRNAGSEPDRKKKARVVESRPLNLVEVSIIETDALLEIRCPHREGMLLDVLQLLRDLRLETTAVQSSLNNAVFTAELRAKVKEAANGKRASIVEVKRAINQIIPHDLKG